eukprot:GFUD01014305.1.p1 GENE.GFUD01014305.1~~GFUD01014305.1.p1  ORF type:complete len:359 (-),score=138.31 GFUD01014305.1:128-1153(-)
MAQIAKEFKNKISLKEFEVVNTSSSNVAGNFSGDQKGFNVKESSEQLKVSVVSMNSLDMEFDMVGYDAAIVNALRRILLSDIPSMAIEKVHMYQNTSIMQDEVLAHRLGLIPLTADPRLFSWPAPDWSPESGTDKDTLEFSLAIKCTRSTDPSKQYNNSHVLTKHLKWVPRGEQEKWIGTTNPGPAEQDILVNKLRPGHEMDIKMFAVKGIGRDHAKFSPVSTAFYRLLPSITLTRPVVGEAALRLQKCFSPGVIELEEGPAGAKQAVVVNERIDSCSRNVYRYDDLRECVSLDKVKDHFIFTVESVGSSSPQDLVSMAWDVIIEKCDHFIGELQDSQEKK